MQEPSLSTYGQQTMHPSPVSQLMTHFSHGFREGIDVNLGVGYVNEATIPRKDILSAIQAVESNPERYPSVFNYGGPKGAPFLLDAIKRQLLNNPDNGLNKPMLDALDIVIGTSGATSLLQGIAQVLEPGIVITADPVYYIYTHTLERLGFQIIAIPEDEQGINPEHVEQALAQLGPDAQKVRFFYFVTVNNPSGTVLSHERQKQLIEIAQRFSKTRAQKVPIIFDNAYTQLIHDPNTAPARSVLPYDDSGITYEIETMSKILAPALRVGYIMGQDGSLLHALTEYNSDSALSAPMVTQAITSWLLDTRANEQISAVKQKYHEKATRIQAMMAQYFTNTSYSYTGGQAGFYFYVTFDTIETHAQSAFFKYCNRMTKDSHIDGPHHDPLPRVAYIPGVLCVHKEGKLNAISKRQLRLSYGYEECDNIERGLQIMRDAIEYASKA